MPDIEFGDASARRGQDLLVPGRCCGVGVGEVAEHREMQSRVGIAEGVHLEMREQFLDRGDAAEQGRDDHHRPAFFGDAVLEIEPRQPARPAQSRRQALHGGRREVGGRQQREQRRRDDGSRRTARAPRVPGGNQHQQGGHRRDGQQVERRRMPVQEALQPARRPSLDESCSSR